MNYTGVNQAVSDFDTRTTHNMPGPFRSVVRGFSRYAETVDALPLLERIKLVIIIDFIVESFLPGNLPIISMRLVGHADTDPQREQREPGFLQKISKKRAEELERYLRNDIARRTWTFSILNNTPVPAGPRPDQIRWVSSGAGASQPDEENVRRKKTHANMTEAGRKLNRRVEIFIEPGLTPVPQPTDPRVRIGMTLLEVLDLLKQIHPPNPLPPWMWDPRVPGTLNRDEWKRFKKMVKERLKVVDVDTVLSTLKDMILKDPSQTSDWTNSLRQMVDEIEKRRREGQKEWWKDDDD